MNEYEVEVSYMVDGCGKKIQSTRMVTIRRNGVIIYQEKTQENVENIMKEVGRSE